LSTTNFVDYVKIFCRSGKGGAGSAHFYRDKRTAKGGPDGGNGGRGGHIILRGNRQLWTLLHLKYRKHVFADNGGNGSAAMCTGAEGEDVYIDVPLGTIVKDAETEEVLFEITEEGQEKIMVKGGRGGMGNTFFKSATFQTPRFSQPGEDGIEIWKILELKVLADVGLVGFPSAGKSTLLSVISAAKPKIGDYPFTTLTPHLGVVNMDNYKTFVIADIPGIIEGAHEGTGLGIQFLKHIERTKMFLHIVEYSESIDEMFEKYNIINNELHKYNEELSKRPQVIAISKSDLIIDDDIFDLIKEKFKNVSEKIFFMSAPLHQGTKEVVYYLYQKLQNPEN